MSRLIVALDYPRWFSLQRLVRRAVSRLFDRRLICKCGGRAVDIFAKVGELYDRGDLKVFIQEVLPIEQAAIAHELIQQGHVRGKIVLTI